jgi:hypothetical protein
MRGKRNGEFFIVAELYIRMMLCLLCEWSDKIDELYGMEKILTDDRTGESVVGLISSMWDLHFR